MINASLHVLALIVYLGAIIGLSFILFSSIPALGDHESRVHLLIRGLKIYDPLNIGALGIVLFTGAFQLTELKAEYRELFVQQLGYHLALKLFFAFFLVIFSVYQCLGIGHRLVRRQEMGENITAEELAAVIRRLKVANTCIIVLAAITIWLGLRLAIPPS